MAGGPDQDPNNPVNASGQAGGIYTRSWTIDTLGHRRPSHHGDGAVEPTRAPGSVVLSSNTKGSGV